MIAHPDYSPSDVSAVLSHFPGADKAWPRARWTWDPRSGCAVGVTTLADWPAIEEWLGAACAVKVSSGSAPELSARQRAAFKRFGGIWPGQLGFTDPEAFATPRFALVWPWTDGVHVSIRLGASLD